MTQAAPKLFKRESGQIRAVTKEAQEFLEVIKVVVNKVKSDPPPTISPEVPPEEIRPQGPQLAKAFPDRAKVAGLYRMLPGEKDDDEKG